jgi:tryptophan-rich sensory protein
MATTDARRTPTSEIALGAAAAILLSLAVNALVFALGWNDASDAGDPSWAPPGWFVGVTWVVLFGLMGAARQLAPAGALRTALDALIVACAIYPLYTGGLEQEVVGLVGSLATLAYATFVAAVLVARGARAAALLLMPVLAWLAFASVLTSASLA